MARLLDIDASHGEGGGQAVRTALALSVGTGRPVRLQNIRAGRDKPGLMRAHIACVRAAAAMCGAAHEGAVIGSPDLTFWPGVVRPGPHTIRIGAAGSAMPVLQMLVPPLLRIDEPSEIIIEGGTHMPGAPPWEVIDRAWLPALAAMGASVEGRLERHGFLPATGGRVVVRVTPGDPVPLDARDRREITEQLAEAMFANLSVTIAERELETLSKRLGLPAEALKLREVKSDGPGNALVVTLTHGAGVEVVADFGVKTRSAENVAISVAREVSAFLASGTAIGRHLADQLVVPMALMGGGRFTTFRPTRHTVTNADIINRFAPGTVQMGGPGKTVEIEVAALPRETT